MLRYLPNTVMLVVGAVLFPAAYWAQANGFAGGDERAMDAFADRSGTDEVAGFIYLGWAVYLWISRLIWGPGMALRRERMQGSLEMLFLTPVSRATILFGPPVAQLVPTALVFTVVGLLMKFAFGVPLGLMGILGGVAVVLASVPVLFAIGAIISVSVLRFRDAEGIASAASGFLAILCGVTYPIAVLPEWIRPISLALPPTQVLNTLRASVLRPDLSADLGLRLLALLGMGLAVGSLAMLLMGLTLRAVRRTGRLGQF